MSVLSHIYLYPNTCVDLFSSLIIEKLRHSSVSYKYYMNI